MRPKVFAGLDTAQQKLRWEERATDTRPRVATGFPGIDELLNRGGFAPGELVVLGGRCVVPGTRVLRADLRWVPVEDLEVGDALVAFDEQGPGRKHTTAWVEATGREPRNVYEVVTDKGSVVATADHPWLAYHGSEHQWRRTSRLSPGTRLAYLPPWEHDDSRGAGYLAGWYDGEGCLYDRRVCYTQKLGPESEHVKQLMKERGFTLADADLRLPGVGRHKESWLPAETLRLQGGMEDTLRFLGSVRPERLVRRDAYEGRRVYCHEPATVQQVVPRGVEPVVTLQTSTGTLITDGFLSHNTHTRKTTVMLNIAQRLLRADVPVGFVGLDEPNPSYTAKLASCFLNRPHGHIEDHWTNTDVQDRLDKDFWPYTARLSLTEGFRPSFEQLTGWLDMASMDTGIRPRVVFIDYVALLDRDKFHGGDVTRIPRLFEELQVWTSEQEVVTIALHQVSRGGHGRAHLPMQLENLKYGGEEFADVVLATYRPALEEQGNWSQEQAQTALGDDYDDDKWTDAVKRVARFRNSTMLQLLKNRPGTSLLESGVELLSPTDSMWMKPAEGDTLGGATTGGDAT